MTFDRATGIGGSDVAAILGWSPFRSPFDVWMEKTGDPSAVPVEETPQMRLGRLMEPVLAAVYEEEHPGYRIDLRGGAFTEPVWDLRNRVYAHIDGAVMDDTEAEVGIWEGKTAWDDRDWRDGVPAHYEIQVRTYLAVTLAPWCDVTVFFRQTAEFRHYRIEAEPRTDAGLLVLAERWWDDYVVTRTPPPIDGSAGAAAYLAARYPRQTKEEALVATEEVDQMGISLGIAREEMALAEQVEANCVNAIKAAMGEHGVIEGTGWKATWRRAKGRTVIGWQEVASAYRGLLHQVEAELKAGRAEDALRLFTDNPPDAIMGLYTREGDGTRPFVYRSTGKGDTR